jgi:GTP cyclohydrolase FolE2
VRKEQQNNKGKRLQRDVLFDLSFNKRFKRDERRGGEGEDYDGNNTSDYFNKARNGSSNLSDREMMMMKKKEQEQQQQEPSEYLLDTEYEVQQEKAQPDVQAGIAGLRLLINFSHLEPRLPVTVSILTPTSGNRGVHMSRLVAAAQAAAKNAQKIEDYISTVCKEVDTTQPGSSVRCNFELPYADQFAEICVGTSRKHPFGYIFSVNGITSCPCSKRISGIGHMQRAKLTMEIESQAPLSPIFFGIIAKMSECFSSSPVALLKRVDEANVVLKSQGNSRFVEDVARECLRRFPDARRIEVRSFESIHMHDAVALWLRENNSSSGNGSRKGQSQGRAVK